MATAAVRAANQDFVGVEILEPLDALKANGDTQGHTGMKL